jgi:hypothetical protein
MDLTRGSGISAASFFLAAEMMSDAEPLLSLRATPAKPQAVTPTSDDRWLLTYAAKAAGVPGVPSWWNSPPNLRRFRTSEPACLTSV